MPRTISPQSLLALVGTPHCPHLVDVRREAVFMADPMRIAGAVWRNHLDAEQWQPRFPPGRGFIVYCAHGHNVSEIAAAKLRALGADVAVLEGGIDAYQEAGGLLVAKTAGMDPGLAVPSVWVTRARPKVDRIACPWLIRRFVDPFAAIHFVAPEWVKDVADELGAIPFDIDGVPYSHRGETCSFDTMLDIFGLDDPALRHLARIVRGADTARSDLEPEAAGLLAILLGLSATEHDDTRQLEKGLPIFDALYGWCRHATGERHNWPAGRQAA